MPYPAIALLSVLVFAWVHFSSQQALKLPDDWQGILLSASGGIAIAYVFVELLPKICSTDVKIGPSLFDLFPYFQRHVYIMTLLGFLLFFIVDRSPILLGREKAFWFSFSSYALFNFLVGYSVVDKDDPEVQPLFFFTFAMALHYFINDYSLNRIHGQDYQTKGKWILLTSLFLGWLTGVWIDLSTMAIGLVSAFLGGGVIMNVIRHELPETTPHDLPSFLLGAMIYTMILLTFG